MAQWCTHMTLGSAPKEAEGTGRDAVYVGKIETETDSERRDREIKYFPTCSAVKLCSIEIGSG